MSEYEGKSQKSASAQAYSYIAQKNAEAANALVKAGSLPYENFVDRDGPRVPSLTPIPETQLTDVVVEDVGYSTSLDGYVEIIPDVSGGVFSPSTASALTFTNAMGEISTTVLATSSATFTQGFVDAPFIGFRFVTSTQDQYYKLAGSSVSGTFYISNLRTSVEAQVSINMEARIGGSWTLVGNVSPPPGVSSGSTALSTVAAYDGIRFRAFVGNASVLPLRMSCSIGLEIAGMSASGGAITDPAILKRTPWPFFQGLPEIELHRTIGADAMLTYMGSALVNGGEIAAALVPHDWYPVTDNDPYNCVASLRNDRMDGPLRDGSHVTWRPFATTDMLMRPLDHTARPTSKIVIGYRTQDDTVRLRLRSSILCGFYSTNPIIGRMHVSPPITEHMLEGLFMYYANTPAATENGLHEVKKSLAAMGKKTATIAKALLQYDSQIAALLAAAGQPEAALVVKAAGAYSRRPNQKPNQARPAPKNKQAQAPAKPKRVKRAR